MWAYIKCSRKPRGLNNLSHWDSAFTWSHIAYVSFYSSCWQNGMSSDCTQNTWWIQLPPFCIFALQQNSWNLLKKIFLRSMLVCIQGGSTFLQNVWHFAKLLTNFFSVQNLRYFFWGNNNKWIFYEWAINLLYFSLSLFFCIGTFDLFLLPNGPEKYRLIDYCLVLISLGNLGYPSFKYF